MSLRIIPGLKVIRPADANETALAWKQALTLPGPVALIFTRQDVPILDIKQYPINQAVTGGYIIKKETNNISALIIATGSEVHLALDICKELGSLGEEIRVVSMPSWEIFAENSEEYKSQVLELANTSILRVSLEAGIKSGWERWVGMEGPKTMIIGIDRFGQSGPGGQVMEYYGFSAKNIARDIKLRLR